MRRDMDILRGPTDYRDLFDVSRRLNRIFTDPENFEDSPRDNWELTPKTEVEDTGDHWLISAEIPGVPKDKINVEVSGNRLHIWGEKNSEIKSGEQTRREFGRYEQVLTLPEMVDSESLEAEYKDGILYVAIPKAESVKKRRVEISGGDKGMLTRIREKLSGTSEEKTPDNPRKHRAA